MKKNVLAVVTTILICGVIPGIAQDSAPESNENPIEIEKTEQVDVHLVLVETLVLDRQGRTVAGLTRDDFQLTVSGRDKAIDVFDVTCPAGALDEPKGVGRTESREPPAVGPTGRKIVLLFDYYHLGYPNRGNAVGEGIYTILKNMAPGEEVMVAALANGLRIEQRFTSERDQIMATLQRMNYDLTLWAGQFQPLTERSFFENLATLMEVLSDYDGAKSVVMFSNYMGSASTNDLWFWDVAQRAAMSRTVIYPVSPEGLTAFGPNGGSPALARLATESGGRLTRNTNDITLAYARAQRDMSCRYTLGFYIKPENARRTRTIRVYVTPGGTEVRSPEVFRFWPEKVRKRWKLRAAFADPDRFDDPLVRAFVFPLRPKSAKAWDTLMALYFPLTSGPDGVERRVAATLARNYTVIDKFKGEVVLDPPGAGEPETRNVTMFGEPDLKPGRYELTVVMTDPAEEHFQSTRVAFEVPEVPTEELILQGPVMAREDPDGLLIESRKGKKNKKDDADERIINGSFEPLLVHQVDASDTVLALSETCTVGKNDPDPGAVILRKVVWEDGRVAHRLDPLPLELQGTKKVRCQGILDRIPGYTLEPGEYRLEVVVVNREGNVDPALPSSFVRFTVR